MPRAGGPKLLYNPRCVRRFGAALIPVYYSLKILELSLHYGHVEYHKFRRSLSTVSDPVRQWMRPPLLDPSPNLSVHAGCLFLGICLNAYN